MENIFLYKGIKSCHYTPCSKNEQIKTIIKGQKYKQYISFFPYFYKTKVATENLYIIPYDKKPIKDFNIYNLIELKKQYTNIFIKNNEVWNKGELYVHFNDDSIIYKYFNNDNDAIKFINNIKINNNMNEWKYE